jgi:hypothetical protein
MRGGIGVEFRQSPASNESPLSRVNFPMAFDLLTLKSYIPLLDLITCCMTLWPGLLQTTHEGLMIKELILFIYKSNCR